MKTIGWSISNQDSRQSILALGLAAFVAKEKAWLKDYHRQVFEVHAPFLNPKEISWIKEIVA